MYVDGRLAVHVATRDISERLMGEISARLGSAATLVETHPSLPVRIHSRFDSFSSLSRVAPQTRDSEGRCWRSCVARTPSSAAFTICRESALCDG
jgi:hypothetical protein